MKTPDIEEENRRWLSKEEKTVGKIFPVLVK
jgi:hypothetical protein